tara:strand:- start:2824 stop:3801 length:978 start_codon:yes stop_codon:yes gene_type:complete
MAIITPTNSRDDRLLFHPHDLSENDKSKYAATGTLVGTASVSGGNLSLDGDSDYLTYPDSSTNSLFSVNEQTLGIWFNADTVDDTDQILIAKNDSGDGNKSYKLFIDATTDVIQSVLSSDGSADSSDISSAGTVTAGSDTFVVMTWDGTFHKIYINGVEDGSGFYSSGIFDSDETVSIGADFSTGTAQLFLDGTVYQAFIMGKSLSKLQIENLFYLGKDYRIEPEPKQLLLHENFSPGKIPNDWLVDSTGTFSIEFNSSTGSYYAACTAGTNVTLSIPTDDWSSSDFTDTNTIVAGTPTVARNSSDVTITMSANDSITDVVVRRN